MKKLIEFGKRLLPNWVKNRVRIFLMPKSVRTRDYNLGIFILEKMEKFSIHRAGRSESLQVSVLKDCLFHQRCLSEINEVHQYLQTALMPHYEQNLYEYYRQQQYLILLTFLSYAFRKPNNLASHIDPYRAASLKLSNMRILDYGAGLAFGIIYLLQTVPEKVESVTIVDLDLIHTNLVEYIVSDLCPNVAINILRITNSEMVPDLGDQTFNFIYGKDIFEHIHNPEQLLRTILNKAEPSCIGYFDINDHGEKHLQHIHPELSHLSQVICEHSFVLNGKVSGLSEFVRSM